MAAASLRGKYTAASSATASLNSLGRCNYATTLLAVASLHGEYTTASSATASLNSLGRCNYATTLLAAASLHGEYATALSDQTSNNQLDLEVVDLVVVDSATVELTDPIGCLGSQKHNNHQPKAA